MRPRSSQDFRGSPELQNGCLRALEEAWGDLLVEAFSCQVWSFLCFEAVSEVLQEVWSCVSGCEGNSRAEILEGGFELRLRMSLEVRMPTSPPSLSRIGNPLKL